MWASKYSQRLQYPQIKEYTLNHIRDPTIIQGIYSLNNGYWSLWVLVLGLQRRLSLERANTLHLVAASAEDRIHPR